MPHAETKSPQPKREGSAQTSGPYQWWVSSEAHEPAWDHFLATQPDGHHEQSSLWGQLKGCYGWKAARILIERDGRLVGGVQLLEKRVKRWMIAFIQRGPVIDDGEPEARSVIANALCQVGKSRRLAYMATLPSYHGQAMTAALQSAGFQEKPVPFPPTTLQTATMLIDLTPDLETIQSQMKSKTRQNARKGLRSGVEVSLGGAEDLPRFRELLVEHCKRRKTWMTPPQPDFFINAWRLFSPQGLVKLFLVKVNGETICANFAWSFGDTLRVWKIGWDGSHANLNPNEALYWEEIRWAKENGFKTFDVVSIDPAYALAMQSGADLSQLKTDGMTQFKLGFGGRVLCSPEPQYQVFHPLARLGLRLGGSRLMRSARFLRLTRPLWSKLASGGE